MNKICLENYTLCLLGLSIVSNDVGFWKRCIFCFLFYCCDEMCSWFGEVYSTCLRDLVGCTRHVFVIWWGVLDMSSWFGEVNSTCLRSLVRCTRHVFVIWWGVLDMSSWFGEVYSTCFRDLVRCTRHVFVIWLSLFVWSFFDTRRNIQ